MRAANLLQALAKPHGPAAMAQRGRRPARAPDAGPGLRPAACACGGGCPRCQAKAQGGLAMSQPHDIQERQADAAADQAMAGRAVSALPAQALGTVARKAQGSAAAAAAAPAPVARALAGETRPLDVDTRRFMEARFQRSFGHVRLHTGAQAAVAAQGLRAQAFTLGPHIVFGAGSYAPASAAGRRLIAHELAHTVQQDAAGSGLMIHRSCRSHGDEAFYASSPNYCRDTGFTGMFHTGRTCYREVPVRSSYFECPPGDQVCFNADGSCEDSYDEVSPVESRDEDGSCNLHHGCTWTGHTALDVVPGLAGQAVAPVAEWLGGLDGAIRGLYGAP